VTASMTNRAGGSPLRACRSARLLVDQDPAHEQITGLITPPTPPPGHVRRAFGSKALFGSRVMNPDRCSESGRALSGSFGSRPVNPPSRALAAHTGAPPPQRTHPTRYGALTSALERETPRGLWPRGVDLLRLSAGLVVQSERCSASRAERRAFRLVQSTPLGHRRRAGRRGRTCQLALLSGAERGLMAIDRPRLSRPRTPTRRTR
jgi:hypothetical protein